MRNYSRLAVLILFITVAAGCFGACSKRGHAPNTLLIYICGSTLETYNGYASENIAEMLEADISPQTTVIIEVGGSKSWQNENISPKHIGRYTIRNNQLVLLERLEQGNMGSADTLKAFIDCGTSYAPSDHVSLILWDHGGGTVDGVCADSNYKYDALTYNELKRAFEECQVERFDFVGMDACLMATYSFAEMISDYADYYIASEELIPGTGWDYKTVLSRIGTDSFYDDVLSSYAAKHGRKNTYTLSVMKLSEISKARSAVSSMTALIRGDISLAKQALSSGKQFGVKGSEEAGSGLYDLGLFANALGVRCDFSSFIKTVNGAAHSEATGMSFYFPTNDPEAFDTFCSICPNREYVDFLSSHFHYRPERPIVFENMGYDNGGCMSFILTAPSETYVRSVGYELHSFAGSEQTQKLYLVGTDNDVSHENGVYTVNFHGNWVFLNDFLLHTDVYEEKDTHTVFSANVKIGGELCRLLFTYFKPTRTVEAEGYVIEGDLTSRIHSLTEGTEITVIYEDPIPEDGQVRYEEGTVVWNEEARLSIQKVDAGYYQYIPYVVDIYGNLYYANTAVVYFDGEKSTVGNIAAG